MSSKVMIGILVLASIGGCRKEDSVPPGGVVVQWIIGTRACESAGIEDVEVTSDEDPARTWTFACDAGEGKIEGLRPGTYEFTVEAMTEAHLARYEGTTGPVDIRSGGTTYPQTVQLQAVPATITVEWNFGGPLCAQTDVATVEVLAFDQGETIETSAEAACESGEAPIVVPPGEYEVVVQGRNADRRIVYVASFREYFDLGVQVTRSVVLEECARGVAGCPP